MKLNYLSLIVVMLMALFSCQDDHTPPPPNPNPKYTEAGPTMDFVHPGILHSKGSLDRMKNFVNGNVDPAIGCFRLLQSNPLASSTYTVQGPFTIISRDDPSSMQTKRPSEDDHKAAYLNAIMWYITNNDAHAQKSIEILNKYATTLREIGPNGNDDPLCASLQGFLLVNAAEIIKHTYPSVSADDVKGWENMFRNVFIPVLREFFAASAYSNGNWGTAATKAFMGFGVFLEDENLYNDAVDFFYNGHDNGSLTNYIGETGQCQESGRDQNHVMLGLGHLAEACEIAYNQRNETLYSASENRLLVGYEYTAKYNLGQDVPFSTWRDVTGKYSNWTVISDELRGHFRPVFEIAYNHYVSRKGLEMPYTQDVISRISPEGDAQWCDHPGYGTLLFRSETGMPPVVGIVDLQGKDWYSATSGATGQVVDNDLVITPAPAGAKFRGDIKMNNYIDIHGGNYPILAILISNLNPVSMNLTLDSTDSGTFVINGKGANVHNVISTPEGNVYYWNLVAPNSGFQAWEVPLQPVPTDQVFQIKKPHLKIADIAYDADGMVPFTVKWLKSFRSVNDLNAFLNE